MQLDTHTHVRIYNDEWSNSRSIPRNHICTIIRCIPFNAPPFIASMKRERNYDCSFFIFFLFNFDHRTYVLNDGNVMSNECYGISIKCNFPIESNDSSASSILCIIFIILNWPIEIISVNETRIQRRRDRWMCHRLLNNYFA